MVLLAGLSLTLDCRGRASGTVSARISPRCLATTKAARYSKAASSASLSSGDDPDEFFIAHALRRLQRPPQYHIDPLTVTAILAEVTQDVLARPFFLVVNGVEQDQFGRVQHTTTLRPNGFSNARMLVAVVVDRLGCHVKTLCRKVNHALAIL